MLKLQTERLTIRNFTEDDWKDLQELAIKFEASDMAIYDNEWPTDAKNIQKITKWFCESNNGLAVELKVENKLIGLIFIGENKEEDPLFEGESIHNFGYNFNYNYHGVGYAFEACNRVLEYMLKDMKVDRIVTGTAEANKPSQRLLEKLGFDLIGKGTMSFRQDEEGNPIEFLDRRYGLTSPFN